MENQPLPRFRGVAFEEDSKWGWEVFVSFLGDNENGFTINNKIRFETREEAIINMKKAIKEACDFIQKEYMGYVTGKYIDMKTNETLKWDK